MGDAKLSQAQLDDEDVRCRTFSKNQFDTPPEVFARAGFFCTKKGHEVECFNCHFSIDAKSVDEEDDVFKEHQIKRPNCNYANTRSSRGSLQRSKTFQHIESLYREDVRLETFIDWPLSFLKPEELAKDGFYFLRHKDHCACVFCRGIVGAWELGDTPRGEHKRHFAHCPFLRGEPVGNIPIHLSMMMTDKATPVNNTTEDIGEDVAGIYAPKKRNKAKRKLSSRSSEDKAGDINFEEFGVKQYSGPKRPEFLTYESRLSSYSAWSAELKQTPEQLAEGGFYSCGLSDHVKCFHCGNGLRNWEKQDDVWEQHALWYPTCHFVQLKKGQDFIDEVLIKFAVEKQTSSIQEPSTSKLQIQKSKSVSIDDEKLNQLMELDVIKATLKMGLSKSAVRAALKVQLEEHGRPFTSLETCLETVIQCMEEEAKRTHTLDEASTAKTTDGVVVGVTEAKDTDVAVQSNSIDVPSTSSQNPSSDVEAVAVTEAAEDTSSSEESTNMDVTESNNTILEEQKKMLQQADEVLDEAKKVLSNTKDKQPDEIMETEKTKKLEKEYTRLQDLIMCKICMVDDADVIFLPCRHMMACNSCATAFTNCPLCRKEIKYAFQTIRS